MDGRCEDGREVRAGDVLTATAIAVAGPNRLSNYRVDATRGDGTLIARLSTTAYITGTAMAR